MTKSNINYELLSNRRVLKKVLIEALMENDLETFKECLVGHLRACSILKLSQKTNLGRQTIYDLVNRKREFNPSLKTLGAILEALAA